MEKSDQLREFFQMQTALNERRSLKKNEADFPRPDNGSTKSRQTTRN